MEKLEAFVLSEFRNGVPGNGPALTISTIRQVRLLAADIRGRRVAGQCCSDGVLRRRILQPSGLVYVKTAVLPPPTTVTPFRYLNAATDLAHCLPLS